MHLSNEDIRVTLLRPLIYFPAFYTTKKKLK